MSTRLGFASGKKSYRILWVYKLTLGDSALIGAPVVAFVDETINALRVMRTPAFSGSVVSVASHDRIPNLEREINEVSGRTHGKAALPAKSIKVPRPPNAFILYRQHHHPRIKEAYPEFTNNEICRFYFSSHLNFEQANDISNHPRKTMEGRVRRSQNAIPQYGGRT